MTEARPLGVRKGSLRLWGGCRRLLEQDGSMLVLRSDFLFVCAAIAEIGGAWLV
jgi:hypothetical protein